MSADDRRSTRNAGDHHTVRRENASARPLCQRALLIGAMIAMKIFTMVPRSLPVEATAFGRFNSGAGECDQIH